AKARAIFVLRHNWETVQETATALLEHETLSGVALEALLSPVAAVELDTVPLAGQEAQRDGDS
ncbi:MAG TPA: hypothetical protein VFI03_11110, partial [Solirubrobacterales bacterium]|nr:hypothetical protein [Solirubrobacterales bacterium]